MRVAGLGITHIRAECRQRWVDHDFALSDLFSEESSEQYGEDYHYETGKLK
jgi:hypothetical protein